MQDEEYMRLAIQLARATIGQTSPNPAVGAVVVNHGNIVGVGAHLKAGEGHAEVNALRMAGNKAEGGVIYVTLEPCAHYGQTPPCADLIIEKKLKRVVVASSDPNPLVAGKGLERIRRAGISVETGVLKEEADKLNPFFFHYMRMQQPFVTLKIACSLDGKTAASNGESQWITNEQSRRDGQRLREIYDAILVGIGTVRADDPQLTARLHPDTRQPIRIVLDTYLQIAETARLVTDQAAATWIITGPNIDESKRKRLQDRNVTILQLAQAPIRIQAVLKLLGERGVTSLLVEGGARIHGSFVQDHAFQQLIMYLAPKIIGSQAALAAVGGSGVEHLADAAQLSIESVEQMDGDLKIIAKPREGS